MPRRLLPTARTLVVPVLAATLAGAALTGCGADAAPAADAQRVNQFAEAAQYVYPRSSAAARAEQVPTDTAATTLAGVATGTWVTPEQHPVGDVGPWVGDLVAKAGEKGELPLLVVYGIPQRDCSAGLSGGGSSIESYLAWVSEIAGAAAADDHTVVVLEPDALATATECGLRDQRVQLIRSAVGVLADAGVTTYVDAGHSSWIAPQDMAQLLTDVGVDRVRGISTNVANFQTTQAEMAYAESVLAGLPDAHAVIDTGRNGNGASDDWCNPAGRALGQRPGFLDGQSRVDALLWIKPPGESDGSCGGGPAAGTYWPERAQQLVAAAG